ncbi:hypothetical protein DFH11DRAFT_1570873 [Phellopilus nigrolimitatus]|nr:hypothetical protein DFH11DRAFT_1570873 [Phellopilus nigrolimitatus]
MTLGRLLLEVIYLSKIYRLETVEGKSMAIDSSIWIYQFQATMRDKDGRALINAHVLGFLRRICKLLFYGIKPVFVFDGGAPALKRLTISERKKKKSGAADSHAKIAEKLLAAQLRKEALNHAQSSSGTSKGKSKVPQGPVHLDENTVYLEDVDGTNPTSSTPDKNTRKAKESPVSSAKKSRWQDHDPYRLPEVDMDAAVAKITRSNAPDPRLATEDELRTFIEMMRPEDIDVNSSAFRELPTEVQYEIIGDLRLKSRQTSYKRLEVMLRNSRTPLDFSKAQIQNLKQRNSLTQQLLVTTDSMGKANVTIPIRIASERNREYLLVKNEGEAGGWVLGIRDDGTQQKPIIVDQDDDHIKSDQESDDDGMDMEEVVIPEASTSAPFSDPDLREYQRELALNGVAKRQAVDTAKGRPKTVSPRRKRVLKKQPLFIPDEEDQDEVDYEYEYNSESDSVEDAETAAAVQASLEEQEVEQIRQAIEESRKAESYAFREPPTPSRAGPSGIRRSVERSDSKDDLYVPFTPSRLDTALKFANTGRSRVGEVSPPALFSQPSLLAPSPVDQNKTWSDSDDDMEEVAVPTHLTVLPDVPPEREQVREQVLFQEISEKEVTESIRSPMTPSRNITYQPVSRSPSRPPDDDIYVSPGSIAPEFKPFETPSSPVPAISELSTQPAKDLAKNVFDTGKRSPEIPRQDVSDTNIDISPRPENSLEAAGQESPLLSNRTTDPVASPQNAQDLDLPATPDRLDADRSLEVASLPQVVALPPQASNQASLEDSSDDEAWSKPHSTSGTSQVAAVPQDEGWDAAHEMDVQEEEGEFARFAAHVKGKDLDSVRHEIDEEIRQLHQQRKAAMRDSEDVTQAMIAQIMTMLRLFGIPYITAPMEAEAQCAALVQLGLVDGIITDDSDVFLFGGGRVFKNMFNQSKTVECFLLTDLSRELGLDRGTLVRLAYLLGSDYVEGVPGVGPVVAMELLREFPGDDGLHKFKDWWLKVQTGRDKDSDNISTFRKRFKKRFKNLYLSNEWPNPAVRDAYYHPVVDTSEEPFKWGLPDLDGLRDFFREELSWGAGKVDELLLPIIHKMNKRGQEAAANRQGSLNDFFSVSAGSGAAEPRKRQVYPSQRLQTLVAEHRKAQARARGGDNIGSTSASRSGSTSGESAGDNAEVGQPPAAKKRKKETTGGGKEGETKSGRGKKGKGRGGATRGRSRGTGNREMSASTSQIANEKSQTKRKRKPTKPTAAKVSRSDSEDEFKGTPSAAPARDITLRDRVRPRPAYQGQNVDALADEREQQRHSETVAEADKSGSEGSEYQD